MELTPFAFPLCLSPFAFLLLGRVERPSRGTGPAGKLRQLFEAASRLPRSQQQKVAAVLEPFILQHANSH